MPVDGVKLRSVEEILRDMEAKANGTFVAAPPPPPPPSPASHIYVTYNMPEKVKQVLDIVNEFTRKRNINTPTSSRSSVTQSIETNVTKALLQDVSPPFVSSIKGKGKAGLTRKPEVSPSYPYPPPKSSATSRKQKDKGKARSTLKVQQPSDAKPPPVPVLKLGVKRSVDELAAPNYKEQNLPDADLEEGEARSPSPISSKKQKTAASSTPAIKPRPKSPRRRKSCSMTTQTLI